MAFSLTKLIHNCSSLVSVDDRLSWNTLRNQLRAKVSISCRFKIKDRFLRNSVLSLQFPPCFNSLCIGYFFSQYFVMAWEVRISNRLGEGHSCRYCLFWSLILLHMVENVLLCSVRLLVLFRSVCCKKRRFSLQINIVRLIKKIVCSLLAVGVKLRPSPKWTQDLHGIPLNRFPLSNCFLIRIQYWFLLRIIFFQYLNATFKWNLCTVLYRLFVLLKGRFWRKGSWFEW